MNIVLLKKIKIFTTKIITHNFILLKLQFHRFSKITVLQSLMILVFDDIEAKSNDNSMRRLPIQPLLKLFAISNDSYLHYFALYII